MYKYIFTYFEYFLSKVLAIKAIDLYMDNEDGQSTPRVYLAIEENDIEYPSLAQQVCSIEVTVKLLVDINSSFVKGNTRRESNFKLLSLVDQIVKVLHSTDSSDLPDEMIVPEYDINNCVRINTIIEDSETNLKFVNIKFNILLDNNINANNEIDEVILLNTKINTTLL